MPSRTPAPTTAPGSDPMPDLVVDVVGVRVGVYARRNVKPLRKAFDTLRVDEKPDRVVDVTGLDIDGAAGVVMRAAIECAPGLLLHSAGVVRDEFAVLFPGESGIGKSTVTAACVRSGLGYMSDEMISIDPASLQVTGFGRPLMLTMWALDVLGVNGAHPGGKVPVPAADLDGVAVRDPVPPGHVIQLERGEGRATLVPLTAGETLACVLDASFNHFRHGEQAWRVAAEVARGVQGWRLQVDDLGSAVDAICQLPESLRLA